MSLDLFVPALAGYLILRFSNATRFRLSQRSGYHVAFLSALVGMLPYAGGWILVRLLPTVVTDFFSPVLPSGREKAEAVAVVSAVGICSLALAAAIPVLWNIRCKRKDGLRLAAEENGDHLELLLDQAGDKDETVEVTVHGGKTFIGYVVESGMDKPGSADVALVLLPVFSGYRSERDRRLVLTTDYRPLLDNGPGEMWERLKVAIPRSEVRWARLFDHRLYALDVHEEPPEEVGAETVYSADSRLDRQ